MQRIAITGATSMLGRALIEESLTHNVSILAFVHKGSSNLSRLPSSPLIKILECDLSDMADFDVGDEQCDVFYHFAWGSTDKSIRDNPEPQLENIKYTFDAVNLASRLGCKKFVGAGSQAEYGVTQEIITEETRVNPLTSYGVAKFAAGKLCAKLCAQKNMICIWPRIFSVYGPYESPNSLVSYLLGCCQKGETANVSAGLQNWEYLYQSDAARFFLAIGEKCNESRVYTLSSRDTRPLKDYILEVQKITDGKLKVEFTLPNDIPMMTLHSDISDLVHATGVEPEVSFKEGITKMINYHTVTPPPLYICKVKYVYFVRVLSNWRYAA